MRKFQLRRCHGLLVLVLCAVPMVHAQETDSDAVAEAPAEAGGDAGTVAGDDATADAPASDTGRSGFGQVMSVLTNLLQDAARREASGRGDGLVLDNPAIEISVTPVEGHSSLLRADAGRAAIAGDVARGTAGKRLAGGTPR